MLCDFFVKIRLSFCPSGIRKLGTVMNLQDRTIFANAILAQDSQVTGEEMCRELTKTRQLSKVVRCLNHDVLSCPEAARVRAIRALTRLGLWVE